LSGLRYRLAYKKDFNSFEYELAIQKEKNAMILAGVAMVELDIKTIVVAFQRMDRQVTIIRNSSKLVKEPIEGFVFV